MPGILYVVATPIGNLADASPRSIEALKSAALIACEDTRTSRTLLARYGITSPTVAMHAHNEQRVSARLLEALAEGNDVALVTDAGTPAVSDPGAHLVQAAHRAGVRVMPIPGPSAVTAAVSAAGFPAIGYVFTGFLPAGAAARRKALAGMRADLPIVIYEAPHRAAETLRDLVERFGAAHEIVIARELTKKFEEVARMPLGEAQRWLEAAPHRQQGEFVFVLAPAERPAQTDPLAEGERVLGLLLESLPASEAARLAAKVSGAPKNALYRIALERAK